VFDWLSRTQQFTLDTTLITTLLVVSVHLCFRAGIFSLGTMGFAALGGYTTAILVTKEGWPTWYGIPMGALVAAVVGAIFAAPVLRLRGIYLALGSLALAQIIIVIISNIDLTNKLLGFSRIPRDVKTEHLILILVPLFVLLQLDARSHFWRAIRAVRLDERTASGFGINVRRYRFNAFVASAALAGLAGALEAHRTTTISPDQYGFFALIPLFTYALIGGNDHWAGPVLTTWGLVALRQWASFEDKHWENICYGALIVLVMIAAPGGLTDPALRRKIFRRRAVLPDDPPATRARTGGDVPQATDASIPGAADAVTS
jgi:branched-chain amino acid transport system permease protein